MVKKIIKVVLIFILVIIVAALAVPLLFKGKIEALAKREINKNINAKVDFRDVDISLFRHFPRLSIGLDQLSVTGIDEFAGDTLIAAKKLDIALNLMSAIRGREMKIYTISLQAPQVHAIIAKDGKANWDIAKASSDTATGTPSEFNLNLHHYKISDAYIVYDDKQANMHATVRNLDHTGSGDFTADNFTLQTSTTADAVTFVYDNIPYLYEVKTSIDAAIQVDNLQHKYGFSTDKILLNALRLSAGGYLQMPEDSGYVMDITFKAPSTDFKNILSLIPAIYQHDFNDLSASGSVSFNGSVKGIYDSLHIPAYGISLDIRNGSFKYPDLPAAVKNITLNASINNPDGITDHTVINIANGHLEMDGNPFDFRLLVNHPISNMFIDAALRGKLDLSQIARFAKMDKGTQLSGSLNADITAKGNVSALEKQQYSQFSAAGNIGISNFSYISPDMPEGIKISDLQMTFNPANVSLNHFDGSYLQTRFNASGTLDNLFGYALQHQPLTGTLQVKADNIDLNKWMGTDTAAAGKDTSSGTPFTVPDNVNFTLNAAADQVKYDKLVLNNVTGKLLLKDQTATLSNIRADALDGTVTLNGSYSTKENKQKPNIAFSYDLDNLDVQKTFQTLNTVQLLMPVAQFISGKLSSHLQLTGKLNDNMSPVLSSLTGNGNLLLIQGLLQKFAPVEQLANTLNITALKGITMKDVKTAFSFENGRVNVKPFTLKVNNITMEIAGSHGFDQSLDYTIGMAVPRSLIGTQGNKLIDGLVAKANAGGIPVKVSDEVNLQVALGGTIKQPAIKTDLKEIAASEANSIKAQATDYARQQIDSAKATVSDSLNKVKQQLGKSITDQARQLLTPGDSTAGDKSKDAGTNAKQTLKNTLNNLLHKKTTPADTAKGKK